MRFLPLVAIVLALGLTAAAVWQISETPDSVVKDIEPTVAATPSSALPVVVPVASGESPEEIGERLEEADVINSALHFRILVSLLGYDKQLQAGDYEFDRGMPTLEVLLRIRNGIVTTLQVTIPEGLRREEIAAILEDNGAISARAFLAATRAAQPFAQDFDFLAGLPEDASLEGYLFPATYFFRRNISGREAVETFLRAFDQRLTPELRQEALDADLSIHTVVTLASIVEREARLAEERPIIAQVFLKRLDEGMRLEADPTVQYALGNDSESFAEFGYWKQELTDADLGVDSPYNTYLNNGLPLGPIANPGLDSILAVLRPSDTNYLFFVAKPDGSHAFAETLEEHDQNVERYQGETDETAP